mgnify:CR=1 FL=1
MSEQTKLCSVLFFIIFILYSNYLYTNLYSNYYYLNFTEKGTEAPRRYSIYKKTEKEKKDRTRNRNKSGEGAYLKEKIRNSILVMLSLRWQ